MRKKTMIKNRKIKNRKNFLEKLSDLWVVGAFVIGMFYTEDYYFNMLEAKASCVILMALSFVLCCVVAVGIMVCTMPKEQSFTNSFPKFRPLDYAVVTFGMATVMSNLVTDYKKEAFWGSFGWRVGTLWVVLLVIVYLFLKNSVDVPEKGLYAIAVCVDIELAWVVANGFYVDILGYHDHLAQNDYGRYVGSVGNTNWYVGLLSMVLPFLFYGALYGATRLRKGICYLGLVLGGMSAITVNCDGLYPALFVLVAGSLFYGLLQGKTSEVLFLLGMMCGGAGLVFLLSRVVSMVPVDGLAAFSIHPLAWGSGLVGCFLLGAFMRRYDGKKNKKVAVALLAVCALVVFGGLVYVSRTFDNAWGTNRGRIWKKAVTIYREFPVIQKIFGGGTNCFGLYYKNLTGSEWVRNAHNEFLEYLVCTGAFGVCAYGSVFVMALRMKVKEDAFLMAGKLAIAAYLAQAFFNNPQGFNGAVFFTILAMYRRKSENMI